jgi:hypothetical protein
MQYAVLRRMRGPLRFIAMPNVIAERMTVPELIQDRARGDVIAAEALRLLEDGAAREHDPTPDERKVLDLVNGSRTVEEIARLSGQGEFESYAALYETSLELVESTLAECMAAGHVAGDDVHELAVTVKALEEGYAFLIGGGADEAAKAEIGTTLKKRALQLLGLTVLA